MPPSERIYIADLAEMVGRAEHTIRQWIDRDDFPRKLLPKREGGRQKLYWTPSQIDGIRRFAAEREANRGTWGRPAAA